MIRFNHRPQGKFCLITAMILMTVACAEAENVDYSRTLWRVRLDIGGTIPETAELTGANVPLTDQTLKLDPGVQFDVAAEYQITEWLGVGPEIGFMFNAVDSVGGESIANSFFSQCLFMGNVVLRYPTDGPVMPFVGVGGGGAASFMTLYDTSNYYYWGGYAGDTGSDFVLVYQLFGGVSFRLNDQCSLGVIYRFLNTDSQHWDVDVYNGPDVSFGIDSLQMHSLCLIFSARF